MAFLLDTSMIRLDFEEYLFTENRNYLGEKVGDILTSLQDLSQNGKAMGQRQMMRRMEGTSDQIRKILHSRWQKSNEKYLPVLQKVGTALMNVVDGESQFEPLDVVNGSISELEGLLGRMKVPVNTLASAEPTPEEPPTTAPPEGQQDQAQQPQPNPNTQQQPPAPDPNTAPPNPNAAPGQPPSQPAPA